MPWGSEGSGGEALWGVAEDNWFAQPGGDWRETSLWSSASLLSHDQQQNLREQHEAESGSFRLGIRKKSPRVTGHWNRLPRKAVRAPSPAGAQEEFGAHSQALGGILGVSCSGPRAGLNDPDGSLPIQHILWFVETIFILEERGFLQLQNSIKYNFLQFWCVQGITENARLSHRYYSKLYCNYKTR